MYYCHCQTYRKANGSSFATNMIYLADKAAWTEICDGLPQMAESLS
jgi:hypothetical protein